LSRRASADQPRLGWLVTGLLVVMSLFLVATAFWG
jgi:hypothetical protein